MGSRAPLAVASAVAALVVAPTLALGEGSAAGQADDPASPSFDLQGELREEIEDELERAAERQSWLAGDAAREQREQTLTAFADLGAAEAREALVSEFRSSLDSGEPASPVGRGEVAEYLDPHTALLEVDGSPALTESALPLLAADEAGQRRPVDLSLEHVDGRLESANALADVSLPATLEGEVAVGGAAGIGVALAGADPDAGWLRVGETGAIYANVAPDRDLLVLTRPTGAELSTVIRSPAAAATDRFELSLPSGASLRELPDGSIAIESAGEALGRIGAPLAFDAQGRRVPVQMRAEGDSFVLATDFKGGDWAYPILVDPLVETYDYTAGAFSTTYWPHSKTSGSPFYACPGHDPSTCNWFGGRIAIYAPGGSYPAGATGAKKWSVPHGTSDPDATTAWISSASFGATYWLGNAAQTAAPLFLAGVFDPREQWYSAYYAAAGDQSFGGSTINLTPSGTPPGPIDDGQQVHFLLWDFTSSATSHTQSAMAYANTATITITDPDPPTQQITANTFPGTGWVRQDPDPQYSITASASDPGLGVESMRLYKPKVGGTIELGEPVSYELDEKFPSPACTGGRMAPCPQNLSKTFSYATTTMPEGRNKLFVESWDPLAADHFDTDTLEVRIDRSSPTIELSGSLIEANGKLGDQEYELEITARDGSAESPNQERSGVKDIQVLLDGQQVAYQQQSCPAGSCEQEMTYQLDAAGLAAGPHTVEVKSTDQAANVAASQTIHFDVEGIAGALTSPRSGDTTAKQLRLESERHDPDMTGVSYEFRRPGVSTWQQVPLDKLKLDHGSPPSSYPLTLDSEGKAPPVTWDVPQTSGIDGTDGAIRVRARFNTSSGPQTIAGDNPSLYWRLGEPQSSLPAADSSGNDNLGTYVGGPAMVDDGGPSAAEDDDGAVDLAGSSQYVASSYMPFVNGTSRSFAGWAKRDASSTIDTLIGGSGATSPPRLRLEAGSQDVTWRPDSATGTTKTWSAAWPGNGSWVHWALVFNESANTVSLYIDGSLVSTKTDTDPYSSSPGAFMAGARGIATNPDYFDGKLDEVAVYERALTLSEAQSHMDGTYKGFSQVVPVTLDRDDTTAKHASAAIGPGSLDLLTGNFSLSADDVSVASYGSDLTVSRTFNSREPGVNPDGPFGPGWVSSLPVDSAGSDYVSLSETGPVGSESSSIAITASDGTEILFSRKGGTYEVEPYYSGLALAKSGSQYLLTDPGGNVTTFFKPAGGPEFVPLSVKQPGKGAQTTTTFAYETASGVRRVRYALAPVPKGVTCDVPSDWANPTISPGCRVLAFSYWLPSVTPPQPGTFGPYPGRLWRISLVTHNGSTTVSTDVAQFKYDSAGRLRSAWDPRISPALETTYGYDGSGRLETITPPGENAWTLVYQTITGDPNTGRLKSVSRAVPGGGTQKETAYYEVPLGGSGAPYEMGPGDLDDWAQTDVPTDATAIFPPDQDPGAGTPSSYERATVTYMNRNGDAVNVAAPGGEISTSEYEKHRLVRRELSPGNRVRALASADPAATAQELDSQSSWSADGTELTETLGPEHEVVLEGGSVVAARAHTVTTYDEGAPAGKDYHLPTTVQVGAKVSGQSGADADVRTTETEYAWALRQPTATIVDPGSGKLNLRTQTLYDSATGLPTERRLPKANAQGTDAHTTKTVYYSAASNSAHPECGARPEWANLACKSFPGGQPGGSAPGLPTTTYEYNLWNQPTTVTDDPTESGVSNRVSTTTYDAAGRPTQSSLSGGQGTAVANVTTAYSSTTGRPTTTTADGRTITRGYDAIGRQTSYTDADGVTSTTTYDILDRPTQIWDGKGYSDFTYEAASGRLSTVDHPGVGTFEAAYDADGNVVAEAMPDDLLVESVYDAAGNATAKAYLDDGCSVGCELLDFSAQYSIHGQVRLDGATGSAQSYTYDAAGRLADVYDSISGPGCTARHYTYDDNSNRTSSRTVPPLSGGACDTGSSGTTKSHTYDAADRITDSGYGYDAFGRTLTVPAADAGGSQLTATYFADDMVRTLTQSGVTRTFSMDPANRVRLRATGGEPDEVYHYADDSDSPAWIDKNGTNDDWERYLGGVSGMLSAVQEGQGSTAGDVTYELTNLHGDVVGEADGDGDLLDSFDADEFGVPISGGLPDSGYGWLGGKERRSQFDTGVITMGARVYLPHVGRFLQVDPIEGGSANDYDYVNQDPCNEQDLDGKLSCAGGKKSIHKGINVTISFQIGPRGHLQWGVRLHFRRRDFGVMGVRTWLDGKKTNKKAYIKPKRGVIRSDYPFHGSTPRSVMHGRIVRLKFVWIGKETGGVGIVECRVPDIKPWSA